MVESVARDSGEVARSANKDTLPPIDLCRPVADVAQHGLSCETSRNGHVIRGVNIGAVDNVEGLKGARQCPGGV
jgi:hypothetical protein